MMPYVTVNFSELINKNRATLALLDDHPAIGLLRRDGEDLVLSTKTEHDSQRSMVSIAMKFFIGLMQNDATSRELVLDALPLAFPWVTLLPEDERGEFAMELVEVARASDSIDNPQPVVTTIAAWRHTAEIYADPELYAILTRTYGTDFGAVPEPPAFKEGE